MNKELQRKDKWQLKIIALSIHLSLKNKLNISSNNMMKGILISGLMMGTLLSTSYVYAIESNSDLKLSFTDYSSSPKITHINGTKRLIIDFDNASDFKEEPSIINNKLIENIRTQRNGTKLRVAIDTREPVKYGITKINNDYVLILSSSLDFKEDMYLKAKLSNENLPSVKENLPIVKETKISETIVKEKVLPSDITVKTIETKIIEPTPIVKKTISEEIITTENTPVTIEKKETKIVNQLPPQVLVQPINAELEHINLKAQGKTAKLTLDLSDNSVVPTVTQSGNLLIIDLPNVKIPDELQKTMTTLSLGTVVQNMDVATQKGSGRIVLSQSDIWTYSVYQMDKKVVIEIKPKLQDVEKEGYKGKPLTLNFQNMDIRAILQVIADFTGLNIMSSDSVNGSMTVRLKDVPWDQALDLVLEAKNLQKQKQGNVVWVATRQEIADKNKSQLELNNQAAELAPLKLEFFQLNHYKAKEMKEILEGKTSSSTGDDKDHKGGFALLSKRGSIGLDVRNNKIFIQDTDTKLEEIAKIIKKLDMASKQVLIEAKLVVVDDKFERDLGAKFGFGVGKKNGSTGIGLSNSSTDATNVASGLSPTGAAFSSAVTGGGSIGFTILNAITGNMLNIELSALEENNRGKVISNPRLLTADNKKAEIRQGTEIPYVTPSTNSSPATVSFKDAVLSLGVTPQVSPNGRVTMDLEISKDTVGQLVNVQGGGQVPSIDTRKITTQVTVNDGQTVVLGGIYEVTSREDLSKVPFLGDIPWVGNLFKHTSKTNEKVELLIFITPHVIVDEDLDAINRNEQGTIDELDLKKK